MNSSDNQDAIDNFIEWVAEISECLNSDYWNGEDVMGIFFNEFNRYKKKSESGQVFTPDHITSFMYRLIEVNKNDELHYGIFLPITAINIYDEKDYIIQSIKLAEGLTGGKVIALVCLPVIKGNRWNKDKVINQEDREQISRILEEYPLFWLDIEEDIDRLMELCISFFAD